MSRAPKEFSIMRRSIPLLAIALNVLLAGCFTSEAPKFPISSAVAAFGNGGHYVIYEHVDRDEFRRQGPLTVKRMPDGTYEFIGDNAVLPISFHEIGNGIIVAQAKPDDNKHAYSYLFLTRNGAASILHLPQCDQQDPAVLSAYGVVHRGKYECSIDKVADPAKLFSVLIPGDPTSKIVPDK
jgi:hypothetical protein